jgi:hypothetical protein
MAAVSGPKLRGILAVLAVLALVSAACDPAVTSPTPSVVPSTSPSGPGPSGSSPSPATVAPTAPANSTVSWSLLVPAGEGPAARSGHTWSGDPATAQAYLYGGADGDVVMGDLWTYDLNSDAWERVDPAGTAPVARSHHSAVWVDGLGLIVVGGRDTSGSPLADAWRFDPLDRTWSALPTGDATPPARSGACLAAAPDGRLWLTHGRGPGEALLSDTWVYDPFRSSWTDATPSGDPAPARTGHACWWADDGRLAIHGGTTASGATGDVWSLTAPGEPDGAWAVEPDLEAPVRSDAAVARNSDRFVVAGGLGADGAALTDIVTFDATTLATETYGPEAGGPSARSGPALVDDPANERMVLFGGLADGASTDELWQLEVP